MEYQKLLDIVVEYIERSTKAEDSQKFCNNFMEEFYNLQDRLEKKFRKNCMNYSMILILFVILMNQM